MLRQACTAELEAKGWAFWANWVCGFGERSGRVYIYMYVCMHVCILFFLPCLRSRAGRVDDADAGSPPTPQDARAAKRLQLELGAMMTRPRSACGTG